MVSLSDRIDNALAAPVAVDPNATTTPAAPPSLSDRIDRTLAGNPIPTTAQQQPEPSFWRNTVTAVGRGVGDLLDTAGQAAMIEQQAPPEVIPKPGEVSEHVLQGMTGGQPYKPQTYLGDLYQRGLTDTIRGAPLAAIGGPSTLVGRQVLNALGSFGGELGHDALPSHPIIGSLLGMLAGGAAGGAGLAAGRQAARYVPTSGAIEREALTRFGEQPAFNMSMNDIDQTLGTHGGSFWTPGRIAAASELNKRQAVNNLIAGGAVNTPPAAPPGLFRSIGQAFSAHPWLADAAASAAGALGGEVLAPGLGHIAGPLVGAAAGEAGNLIRRGVTNFLQNNRAAALNQGVEDMLRTQQGRLWQQFQQPSSGLMRYATGLAAPLVNVGQ